MATLSYIHSLIESMRSFERIKPPISINKSLNNFTLPQWSLFYRGNSGSQFGVIGSVGYVNPLKQDEYFENISPRETSVYTDAEYAGTLEQCAQKLNKDMIFANGSNAAPGVPVRKYLDEQLTIFNTVRNYERDNTGSGYFVRESGNMNFVIERVTTITEYNEAGEITDETITVENKTTSTKAFIWASRYITTISAGTSGNYISETLTEEVSFTGQYIDEDKNLFYLDKIRFFTFEFYSDQYASPPVVKPPPIYEADFMDMTMNTATDSSVVVIPLPPQHPSADLSSTGYFYSSNDIYRMVAKIKPFTWAELKAEYPKPESWI